MTNLNFRACLFSAFAFVGLVMFGAHAAEPDPALGKVLVQAHGHTPVESVLDDAAWLEGHWIGSRYPGHQVEHIVLPVASNHMPGFVRSWDGDDVFFFEITNFESLDGVLHYRVKHFSDDLTGWEAADEVVSRPLLGKNNDSLQFDSITFERTSQDSFTVYYRFPDGPREGELLTIPFFRSGAPTVDDSADLTAVRKIFSDLDNRDLLPADQLKNYDQDAVILPPGETEIRGLAAIRRHLANVRDQAVVEMTHHVIELSSFADTVIVQGKAVGTAQPHGDPDKYPFETKNLILFRRAPDQSLKIWKVIYNQAPDTAGSDPELYTRAPHNPFANFLGTWALKEGRFEQVWDGETLETVTILGHRTECSVINTSQSTLCRVNAGDFQGHILWAYDEEQKEFGHLSHFGTSRLGQGRGQIEDDGSLRIRVSFSDEPDGTFREYRYDWVSEDEYIMQSIQYDASNLPTGNRYGGTFIRE